jgi:threonylcarbamoyladenosine tRNA methylthiotransferase MtaB
VSNRVITFGCRLNAYESDVIATHLKEAGDEQSIVINSCAVTSEAERQLRQTIRRTHKDNPQARIIVTGCAAQIHPDRYAEMPEVHAVIGNEEKLRLETYQNLPSASAALVHTSAMPDAPAPIQVNDIMSVTETALHMVEGMSRTRGFLQVQNGCNHRCTFCIIPYGRGNSRSVPVATVLDHARQLVAGGYKELVITGVDISDYGKDLPESPSLGTLLKTLLQELPDLPRLRLSSIDAVEVDDELKTLFTTEARLMPYLHLSLQAGSDMILKRMKRRHLRQHAIDFCQEMRNLRPDIVFGADIIAGFPTESEEMFQQSLDIVDECGLTYLHVFPYSEREGTPAARMPQLPKAIRRERANRLREKGDQRLQAYYTSLIGQKMEVLFEANGQGRTQGFAPVRLSHSGNTDIPEQGSLKLCTISGTNEHGLEATLSNEPALPAYFLG